MGVEPVQVLDDEDEQLALAASGSHPPQHLEDTLHTRFGRQADRGPVWIRDLEEVEEQGEVVTEIRAEVEHAVTDPVSDLRSAVAVGDPEVIAQQSEYRKERDFSAVGHTGAAPQRDPPCQH